MYEGSLFPALEFVCNQIVSSLQDVASFNRFFLECMLFVHGTLKNTAYEGKITGFAVGAAAKAQVRNGLVGNVLMFCLTQDMPHFRQS
jgi:hypothetical protein